MKKLSIMASLLMGLVALSSCESDRDDNPTLIMPNGFTLLAPEFGENVIDLENSSSIQFKAQAAPNYSFPTETSYWMEMTLADNFEDAAEDEIFTLDTKGNSITYDCVTTEMDLGVMKLKGWSTPEDVDKTTPVPVTVRMVANLSHAESMATAVRSNAQKIYVYPYYLKESLPQFWYLTGANIATNHWKNSLDDVGTGMVPMYVKKGETYNKFTGDGTIEYVGYFLSGEFKIIAPKGLENWNFGICGGNITDGGGFQYRDGGDDPGNIGCSESGFYRLTLNTAEHELKAEKYEPDEPIVAYASMSIGETAMDPVSAEHENHDWYAANVTVSANTAMNFKAGDGTTWGTEAFPYGISTVGGAAIKVTPGTYKVFFNDITGAYHFVEVE